MIASIVIIALAVVMLVVGTVFAVKNRAVRIPDEFRRAGEDESQDPAMKADLFVNRSGDGGF